MSTLNGGPGNIVTNGLVLYLDAANYLSYTSGSTVWRDLSSNNLSGSLVNGPTFNTGSAGSIVFDGVDDYVETGVPVLTSNASYTMGVWAISSTQGSQNRVMGNGDSTGGTSGTDIIWAGFSSNTISVIRRNGSNDGTRDMQSSIISNLLTAWHYVTVTYNNTSGGSILYVDTIQVASNTTLGFTCSLPFRIGRDGNGTDRFNGNIANVHLYNRALTAQEVLQNYNAQKSRFGL